MAMQKGRRGKNTPNIVRILKRIEWKNEGKNEINELGSSTPEWSRLQKAWRTGHDRCTTFTLTTPLVEYLGNRGQLESLVLRIYYSVVELQLGWAIPLRPPLLGLRRNSTRRTESRLEKRRDQIQQRRNMRTSVSSDFPNSAPSPDVLEERPKKDEA